MCCCGVMAWPGLGFSIQITTHNSYLISKYFTNCQITRIIAGLKPNGEFQPQKSWTAALTPTTLSLSRSAAFKTPQKAIMSKMVNETLRAQLGRSAWYVLHVMSAKFPLKPSVQEQQTFLDYISLFSQLYPCGMLTM